MRPNILRIASTPAAQGKLQARAMTIPITTPITKARIQYPSIDKTPIINGFPQDLRI